MSWCRCAIRWCWTTWPCPLELTGQGVTATSEVACVGRTGVEMEALVAVSVALLTVYDMCKAVDRQMRIGPIYLVEKVKTDVI